MVTAVRNAPVALPVRFQPSQRPLIPPELFAIGLNLGAILAELLEIRAKLFPIQPDLLAQRP